MKKVKTVEELKILLENKNYKKEEIEEFISFVKPFYDFYDYMLKEHKMNYEDVEKDSDTFSQSIFNEYLEDMGKSESPMKFMMEISGDIMKRYAKKYDYPEPEKVKIALNKYMEFLFVNEMKKK
jgi:hypothetical protein